MTITQPTITPLQVTGYALIPFVAEGMRGGDSMGWDGIAMKIQGARNVIYLGVGMATASAHSALPVSSAARPVIALAGAGLSMLGFKIMYENSALFATAMNKEQEKITKEDEYYLKKYNEVMKTWSIEKFFKTSDGKKERVY